MANTRNVTLITKQSNTPSAALPASAQTGEGLVNTADGKLFYKGFISGTGGSSTYISSFLNAGFFEVGSHLSQLYLDGGIIAYSGQTNLSGKFLSGTSSGFVLGSISAITGVDTFTTGGTYNANTGTITFTYNNGSTYSVGTWSYLTAATLSNNVLSSTLNGGSVSTSTVNAVTGGTYNANTGVITLSGTGVVNGNTIFGLPFGASGNTTITAFTYNGNTNGLIITNNTGGTLTATITGLNNLTGLTSTGTVSANIVSATTYQNLPIDIRVTGGSYNGGTGVITFTNNTGGTFTVAGITTGGGGGAAYTAFTYASSSNTLTLASSAGTISTTIQAVSGLSSTGTISSATLSATTYLNLPIDVRVTGGTYNASTGIITFTNNTGATFTVGGFTLPNNNVISAVTLSNNVLSVTSSGGTPVTSTVNAVTGGTYNAGTITLGGTGTFNNTISGLPFGPSANTAITAFTYTPTTNTFSITNTTGGTLNAIIQSVTGLTVNGSLVVTGNTGISGSTTVGGSVTAANLFTTSGGSAIIGTGGLIVGSGGAEGVPGTGDVIINGSLTVFGASVSAFTSNLYSEDNNITLNYNPTGNTFATSLAGGFSVQNGLGVNGITGDTVFFQIAQTGVPVNAGDAYAKRFWESNLFNIMLGSSGGTGTGNYVLQATDILNGGTY